jgi:hypothetical protein
MQLSDWDVLITRRRGYCKQTTAGARDEQAAPDRFSNRFFVLLSAAPASFFL